MSTTLTIRTNESLRRALGRRAELEHKTVSELVREILEDAVVERPLAEKVGKLRGNLKPPRRPRGWQRQIRERNWRK